MNIVEIDFTFLLLDGRNYRVSFKESPMSDILSFRIWVEYGTFDGNLVNCGDKIVDEMSWGKMSDLTLKAVTNIVKQREAKLIDLTVQKIAKNGK